ncbi:MAG: PilZ domain-containing protein [Acidobacteria bacterium]|nr:PilZ domain-containing protein [Acidobacteriota bacterium]
METKQSPERRRGGRIPHKARIVLSGTDSDGFSFAEETETVTVSKQGLSVRSSYNLALGQELSVRTKDKNRVAQFEVVWLGDKGTPSEGRIGLEWVEPHRFWGVEFLPEDWGHD